MTMTLAAWLWIALSIVGGVRSRRAHLVRRPARFDRRRRSRSRACSFERSSSWSSSSSSAATIAWRVITRRRAAAALEKAMTEPVADESDAPVLKEKMEDALATLKRIGEDRAPPRSTIFPGISSSARRAPARRRRSSIRASSFRSPATAPARAVQGVGGTRYCDWWFTDAGRADRHRRTLHDPGFGRQGRSQELARLPRHAEAEPSAPADQRRHRRDQHRRRSQPAARRRSTRTPTRSASASTELHEELKVDFPVYAVFTKMDLIVGFTQYFADLDEAKRRKAVWGATFQTADKKANNVGKVAGGDRPPDPAHLGEDAGAPAGGARSALARDPVRLSGAAQRASASRSPISSIASSSRRATRRPATLRGFYFTSGTQEGTPFDAVIGALQKSYGVESFSAAAFSGAGKSFFLHDLLAKVIFGEAGWVSTNIAAVRRSFAHARRGLRPDRPRDRRHARAVVDELSRATPR